MNENANSRSVALVMANRILILAGGLCGALGVALSAAAAHAGGGNVGTAASFLLMHAPAFLVIGLLGGNAVLRGGGFVLLAGLALFCGDLLLRHYAGARLFPMAAPAGGTLMILGWLVIAASAFVRGTMTPLGGDPYARPIRFHASSPAIL